MAKHTRSILTVSAVILILCVSAALCWNWYDNNVDRSGWEEIDGSLYFNDFKGNHLAGWQIIGGAHYYFDEDFRMCTGWLQLGNSCYYLDQNGTMQTGWQEIDGKKYYFDSDGSMAAGWLEQDGKRYYFDENGVLQTGWLSLNGSLYYLDENGSPLSGWLELDGQRYYLNSDSSAVIGSLHLENKSYYFRQDGSAATGWVDLNGTSYYFCSDGVMANDMIDIDGHTYYFLSDGTAYNGWYQDGVYQYYFHENGMMATGKTVIHGQTFYFSPHGIQITLVNSRNFLPEGFEVDVVRYTGDQYVTKECADALEQMIDACREAGYSPAVCSSYRTYGDQQYLYNRQVNRFLSMGYDRASAEAEAAKIVAIPGTSEHQLGLAVDIVDTNNWNLNESQAAMPTQKWLMEHCWEYGFILRYPVDKTEVTSIIYEPWHYRYVGVEIAMELRDLGICLEEYLGDVQ